MIVAVIKEGNGDSKVVARFENEQQTEALQLVKDVVSHSRGTKGAVYLDIPGDKPKLLRIVKRGLFGRVKER